MGDQHRHALRLRQGVAEPGAARLGDRPRSQADPRISDDDKAAIAAFAKSAAAGKSMTMVPQYSQLLDILGIMNSGVMSQGDDASTRR